MLYKLLCFLGIHDCVNNPQTLVISENRVYGEAITETCIRCKKTKKCKNIDYPIFPYWNGAKQ